MRPIRLPGITIAFPAGARLSCTADVGEMPTDSPPRKGVKPTAVVLVGIRHIQGQG